MTRAKKFGGRVDRVDPVISQRRKHPHRGAFNNANEKLDITRRV